MKSKIIALMLVLTLVLTACGSQGETGTETNTNNDSGTEVETETQKPEKTYTLKIGTVLTETDPLFLALKSLKANVEEKTEGGLIVELYSGSQLGADEDVLEQAKVGAGVGIITDPGRMSNYVSDFGILGGPYIAKDYEEALEVMSTSVYTDLVKEFQDYGFKILSFNFFQGSRHLFTKNPVTSPADLNGLRIRSSGSDVVTKSLEAMGANTTVLPWSESYQALQQKVIEGVEVHNSAALGSSIYEVTDYLTLTSHFQLLTGLVISNDWFEKLPDEYQTILMDESYEAGKVASQSVLDNDEGYLSELQEKGIEIVEADIDAFVEAAEAAYDELGYRETKDKIDEELGR